jgi:hypothetical protein
MYGCSACGVVRATSLVCTVDLCKRGHSTDNQTYAHQSQGQIALVSTAQRTRIAACVLVEIKELPDGRHMRQRTLRLRVEATQLDNKFEMLVDGHTREERVNLRAMAHVAVLEWLEYRPAAPVIAARKARRCHHQAASWAPACRSLKSCRGLWVQAGQRAHWVQSQN